MRICTKCGCEIVNGVNGCQLLDECFKCHDGTPEYPPPKRILFGEGFADENALNYLEGRCLDDGE